MSRWGMVAILVLGALVAWAWYTDRLAFSEPASQPTGASSPAGRTVQDNPQLPPADIGAPLLSPYAPMLQAPANPAARLALTDPVILRGFMLSPVEEQEVPSRVDGVIEDILVELNQPVTRDTVLAQIDDRQARLMESYQNRKANSTIGIEQAEAQVRVAKAIVESDIVAGQGAAYLERRVREYQHEKALKDLAKAKEDKELAAHEWERAKLELELHKVRSSVDGIVTRIYKRKGEAVRHLEPVFRVQNLSRLRAEGFAGFEKAHLLRPGLHVLVVAERALAPSRLLLGHRGPVQVLSIPSDGTFLASAGQDGRVLLWNWRRGYQVAEYEVGPDVSSLAIQVQATANGDRQYVLAAGSAISDTKVWVLNRHGKSLQNFALQEHGRHTDATALALAPQADYLALGDQRGRIGMWKLTPKPVLLYQLRGYAGDTAHRGEVTWLAFTPGGLLVSAGRDNTFCLWELGTSQGRLVSTLGQRSGLVSQFSVPHRNPWLLHERNERLEVVAMGREWQPLGIVRRDETMPPFEGFALLSPTGRLLLTRLGAGRIVLATTPATPQEETFLRESYGRGFDRHSPLLLLPTSPWLAGGGLTTSLVTPVTSVGAALHVQPRLWPLHPVSVGQLIVPVGAQSTCALFAPDESVVLIGASDGSICLWPLPAYNYAMALPEAVITYVGQGIESGTAGGRIQVRAEFYNHEPPQFMPGMGVSLIVYPEVK
ncbi:MAG: hypothetical protein C4296_01105 [Gemmataceae bacterium]